MKKFFLICLMILLGVQSAAYAKDNGLPEEERIKVALEVNNTSRYKNLPTAEILEDFLIVNLLDKNLVIVLDQEILDNEKPFDDDLILDEDRSAEASAVANIGELLVFDAVELPRASSTPENFDAEVYRELGAAYVVRCEVLGLGVTKVEDKTLSTIFGATGGITALIGSGSGTTNEKLRTIGTAIGMGGFIQTKRTALNSVVNMQFISVETGEILWQENFIGQAIKHHKGGKNYSDAWTRVYNESVEDSAKLIAKRVNKYVDRVIIKGKSDKSFVPKKFSLGKGLF